MLLRWGRFGPARSLLDSTVAFSSPDTCRHQLRFGQFQRGVEDAAVGSLDEPGWTGCSVTSRHQTYCGEKTEEHSVWSSVLAVARAENIGRGLRRLLSRIESEGFFTVTKQNQADSCYLFSNTDKSALVTLVADDFSSAYRPVRVTTAAKAVAWLLDRAKHSTAR